MDIRPEKKLRSIMGKISPKERIGLETSEGLIYNVVGFIPACEGVNNAMLISNIAYMISQKGFNTCVVDLKVFYPSIYHYLDVKPNKKGDGLLKLLKSDKVDFRDEILNTKYERLHLLSPSPQDLLEEYFDFEFENIERVIETLKDMYDIVLIDIPNTPPLEFCIGAMKYCHIGMFISTEKIEAPYNMIKLIDFASSLGISTAKFMRVILMDVNDMNFDVEALKQLGFNVVAKLPVVKNGVADSFEGKLYVKDNALLDRRFILGLDTLVKSLITT